MANKKNFKSIFVICVFFLFLVITVHYISSYWPKYEEKFFDFGLLGANKKNEGYYPGNTSNIEIGKNVTWYINIFNHMQSNQNVIIRVKLLNSTMQVPDDLKHEPSPFEYFTEFSLSLSVNETQLIPFSWNISEAIFEEDLITIKSLFVNAHMVDVNIQSYRDNRFLMIFELWIYNPSLNDYRFGWDSEKGFYSVSLSMWFNLPKPV